MKESASIDFNAFLDNAAILQGEELSLLVCELSNKIIAVSSSGNQKSNLKMEKELAPVSEHVLTYFDPKCHHASQLEPEQRRLISKMRRRLQTLASIDSLSTTQLLSKIEDQYFKLMNSDWRVLTESYRRNLKTCYYNLLIYITEWCQEYEKVWLLENLNLVKEHVKLIEMHFHDDSERQLVLNRALSMSAKNIQDSYVKKLIALIGALVPEPSLRNAIIFTPVFLLSPLLYGFLMGSAAWSWVGLFAFSFLTVGLIGMVLTACGIDTTGYSQKESHYFAMFNRIKAQYVTNKEEIMEYLIEDYGRRVWLKKLSSSQHELGKMIDEDMNALAQQPCHDAIDLELLSIHEESRNDISRQSSTNNRFFKPEGRASNLADPNEGDVLMGVTVGECSKEEFEEMLVKRFS